MVVVATALSPEKKVATQEEKGATQTNKEVGPAALPKNPEVVATALSPEEEVATQEGEVARTQEVKKRSRITKEHSSIFSPLGSTLQKEDQDRPAPTQEEDQVRPAPNCGLVCCYNFEKGSVKNR